MTDAGESGDEDIGVFGRRRCFAQNMLPTEKNGFFTGFICNQRISMYI